MRALLIDATKGEVRAIDLPEPDEEEWFEQVYKLIESDCFCTLRAGKNHMILLDDNGLYTNKPVWMFDRYAYPLKGNGVVVGIDSDSGDTTPALITPEGFAMSCKFHVKLNGRHMK